jgi:hypothetical protein
MPQAGDNSIFLIVDRKIRLFIGRASFCHDPYKNQLYMIRSSEIVSVKNFCEF